MRVGVAVRIGAVMIAPMTMWGLSLRAASPAPISLAVAGRANATPWVASDGPFVAVTWGASKNSATDVFVAISRDSGGTFGAPVQVNDTAGDARLGGELPPRVALWRSSEASDPEVVVLWTARAAVTQVRIARSRDGGRTFESSIALQAPDAAGDRGWPSLAVDAAAPHTRSGSTIADLRQHAPPG